MSAIVLNEHEVVELLDYEGCIEAMDAILRSHARGELTLPLRSIVRSPDGSNFLGLMPSHRAGDSPLYALKTVCVFPDNPKRGLDAHQGTVTLFDGETGQVRALMNASPVTAIRTAACSAVATRALARDDVHELAIVGAGVQGRSHIGALSAVRPFEHIRIASRTAEHGEELAAEFENAEAVSSIEEAVRGADVIVTATNSPTPVIRREWLKPGAHINAVGACLPHTRELDSATVAAAAFFTDSRESCVNEAGDYLLALDEGEIQADHLRGELGDVLTGAIPGRTSDEEITIYESLGIAVEDLAAAEYVVRRAEETGAGTRVEF
jgi:ornithine cyclodeaminase/alanine dehydrogenase-like protein (mu-crystallin family)